MESTSGSGNVTTIKKRHRIARFSRLLLGYIIQNKGGESLMNLKQLLSSSKEGKVVLASLREVKNQPSLPRVKKVKVVNGVKHIYRA